MEYKKRKETLEEYAKMIDVEAIINDDYGLKEFTAKVAANPRRRCMDFCYKARLEKTAEHAKENGFDAFSTTLLVSPYQNHELLKKTGEEISEKYGVKFEYIDFRVGFRQRTS